MVLLSRDLLETRAFYHDQLGLEILEYDTPDLKTVDGVADLGFALGAWIVDPHGNALGFCS